MNEELKYYLSRKHWLTAYPNYEERFEELKNELAELYEEIVTVLFSNDKRDFIVHGIMRKDRSLAGYLAKVIDKGYEKAVTPNREILDKVTAIPQQYRSQMKTGMPSKADRWAIMQEYYGTGVSQ